MNPSDIYLDSILSNNELINTPGFVVRTLKSGIIIEEKIPFKIDGVSKPTERDLDNVLLYILLNMSSIDEFKKTEYYKILSHEFGERVKHLSDQNDRIINS